MSSLIIFRIICDMLFIKPLSTLSCLFSIILFLIVVHCLYCLSLSLLYKLYLTFGFHSHFCIRSTSPLVPTFTSLITFAFSFIRLADYLIVNTMHVLAVNSVSTLLNYLTEQLQNTPTLPQIQGLEDEKKKEDGQSEKAGVLHILAHSQQ